MDQQQRRVGLSLSGGGYRAAAFHLGTLNKLNEMDVLQKVDVLSTISGGSITGAAWCLHKGDYSSFHEEMKRKLSTVDVIRHIFRSWAFIRTILFLLLFLGGGIVLSFTAYSWLVFPVLFLFFYLLFGHQFEIFPVSEVIEKIYNRFYDGKTLSELNERPVIAIGSSNLQTGRPFTFSKLRMSDSAYTNEEAYAPPVRFLHGDFPIARAVMASSCVPFAFTPVRIDKAFYAVKDDFKRIRPVLVDGGVYDNQGIHKITQPRSSYECGIIITSDAGGNFRGDKQYPNAIALLIRTVDLFMYRIKAVQMVQNIYENVRRASKPIAYFSLGWKLEDIISGFYKNLRSGQVLPEVIEAQGFDKQWIERPQDFEQAIRQHLEERVGYKKIKDRDLTAEEWKEAGSTGTNLTALSKRRVDLLIRHAENLTELQIKLYCPMLL